MHRAPSTSAPSISWPWGREDAGEACCSHWYPGTPVGPRAARTSASMRQGWTPKKGIMGKAGLRSTPGGAGRGVIMIPPVSTANSKQHIQHHYIPTHPILTTLHPHTCHPHHTTSPHMPSSPHYIPTHAILTTLHPYTPSSPHSIPTLLILTTLHSTHLSATMCLQ